ncbi:hypothetical protein M758_12G007600 [Ceratodon purpureus]|uniref:Uncharacterized protein n=1 Tax=Ceratodon purpureus TaxID=3225 RepID=A0A8T0G689_CERPU|nr:hypothetical protein KC19_12G006900 [Ceratodon purpureus]KAG0597595.1 hypothetical protein M758_12G007600 [Ceratodon purpureus]
MNRGNINAFRYSMRLRGLKHGSEEEYDMFEDFAVCRFRNGRMNGAADSKLQLEHRTPVASGEDGDGDGATIRAAIAQHTIGDANEHLATEDTSRCTEDGKRSLEKDINANHLKTAQKNYEVKEISNPVGHRPHVDNHVCTQAEESIQPDPSTSRNSAVSQITVHMKCGKPAVYNDPLRAGAEALE